MLSILALTEQLADPWAVYGVSYAQRRYLFICVRTFTEARHVTQVIKPSLCLYDLPVLATIRLYEQLAALKALEHTPTLLISKEALTSEIQALLRSRKMTYLQQPCSTDHFFQIIEKLCSARQLQTKQSRGGLL